MNGAARERPLRQCTIAAGCAFKLAELAAESGVDPRALHVELPPVTVHGIETRIPFERQLELWEAVMHALRDPGFPISVAWRLRPSDYSVVGFACMTRATLRDALAQAVRYARIWTDAHRWDVTERGRTATLTLLGQPPRRLGVRCNTECAVAEMVNAARALVGTDLRPHEVRFRHAAPADTRAHESFFAAPLRFGAPSDGVVFDAAILELPLLKADADLAAFFQRHTDALLGRCAGDATVAERLEAALLKDMPQGAPTLAVASGRVGMSERTLRRRLVDEGTSFHDVLAAARCKLAKRYLGERRLALGEVAFLLGFSEPSAFHRAFKRWTGETPLAYRARAEAERGGDVAARAGLSTAVRAGARSRLP